MNMLKTALLLAALTGLFVGVGFLLGGQQGALLALVFAGGTNLWAWWKSDRMVLKMHKARPLGPNEAPDLYSMTQQLAQRADLPMPALYLIDSDQPNAFATGRSPENSAVAVSTGLLRVLSREEVAAVVAHELAHIANRDTLIMTLSATVAGAISMLAQFALFFGGRDRPMGPIGTLVVAIFAPLAAVMIQMLISRTREYSADRLGGQIVGNPMWLASALTKISKSAKMMRTAETHPASAHVFIFNPLKKRGVDSLFSTHPNVENRIAALKEQAREMGTLSAQQPQTGGSRVPRTSNRSERSPWG